MAASIMQLLSGVLRYFPNVLMMTFLVGGILLAKLSWIWVAAGGLVVAVMILFAQFLLGKISGDVFNVPGINVVEMCSILPRTTSDKFFLLPSMWISLTAFFGAYIIFNASTIYTTNPSSKPKDALPVQQRKGMGLISMLASILILAVLLLGRFFTGCEFPPGDSMKSNIIGTATFLLSIGLGVGMAYAWHKMLSASDTSNADVHGVMAGLTPGGLRAGALACKMT
jgi:hypothetical protein